MRRITEAAGANVASVSYYFGGKEGLYRAVFERLFDEMRERRVRRIESDFEAAGGESSLEEFLASFASAFVEPLVEGERGRNFVSLFDEEMRIQKVPQSVFVERLLEPMLDLFMESLERTGTVVGRTQGALCMMSVVGQLIHSLKAGQRFTDKAKESPRLPFSAQEMMPHFVLFSAAGIRAVAGSEKVKGGSR